MNLDDLLADALHDERLALPVSPDTLTRVRRARARRQRTRAVEAVAAAGSLVLAGVLVLSSTGPTTPSSSLQPGAGGAAALSPTPIPGSTPAYTPLIARDWFLTAAQSEAFYSGYQQPSPRPGDRVPSPQPSGPLTSRLVAELEAAGVPGATDLNRDEAESGTKDSVQLQGSLTGGQEIYVGRRPLSAPLNTNGIGSNDSAARSSVEDVPGTDQSLLLLRADLRSPVPRYSSVFVCTPTGQLTVWSSATIPLAQLKAWAVAAAQWATSHPA